MKCNDTRKLIKYTTRIFGDIEISFINNIQN